MDVVSKKVKKAEYNEKINVYKQKIEDITKNNKIIEKEVLKNSALSNYGRLSIANNNLNIIALYCTMSDISSELLGFKNETFLNNGRKLLYKVFSILEEIVGKDIDALLSETSEKVKSIRKLDDRKKLNFFYKIKDALHSVITRFGDNSKWKWSFVDLEGEATIVMKNMIDFKLMQKDRDPRKEGYVEREELLKMIKDDLKKASTGYREKYEMVTHEPAEMKKAILFLSALYRIHVLFHEVNEAESTKKNIVIWQEKLDADLKAEEERRKRKK